MDLSELQEQSRVSGSVKALNREIKRLLWHEGAMAKKDTDVEALMLDRRITVGAIAFELAAYCNAHDLDLEQCIEEANAKEMEEASK